MSKSVISVEMSDPLMHDALVRAEKAGTSLSMWIHNMVADRVRDEQAAESFFRRRAQGRGGETMLATLDLAPDVPPLPGDELQ